VFRITDKKSNVRCDKCGRKMKLMDGGQIWICPKCYIAKPTKIIDEENEG